MTANARMMIGSWLDDATHYAPSATPIEASSEVSTMPDTNLLNTLASVKWRSGSYSAGGTINFKLDIGAVSNRSVNAFCWYNHNMSNGGSWRLKAYTTRADRDADTTGASSTGVKYDSGATAVATSPTVGYGTGAYATFGYGGYALTGWLRYKYVAHFMTTTPVSARWWRLFITDTTPETHYLECGRIMLGQYFEPSVNFEWGYSIDWVDQSQQIRTRGGALRAEFRTPFRRVQASFQWLDGYDVDWMLEIMRLIGRRGDVLWVAYPDEDTDMARRNIISGRLTDWTPVQRQRHGYQVNITIEESI